MLFAMVRAALFPFGRHIHIEPSGELRSLLRRELGVSMNEGIVTGWHGTLFKLFATFMSVLLGRRLVPPGDAGPAGLHQRDDFVVPIGRAILLRQR